MEKITVYAKIRLFKPKNKHIKNRHKCNFTPIYTYDYDENDSNLNNFARYIAADINYCKKKSKGR